MPFQRVVSGAIAKSSLAAGGGQAAGHEGGDLGAVEVDAARLVELLEGAEEEDLVALDRPAERAAPLVALELGRVLVGHVRGVEGVVAREEEGGGLPVVAAGPRHDVGDAALGPAVLRLVAGGDDLELLDGVLGVADEGPAGERVVVVGAVDEEGQRRRALAEDRDLVEVAAGRAAGGRGGAGHELHEVHELAAVQGQGVDGRLRDARGDLGPARVHDRRLRHHVHGLLEAGGLSAKSMRVSASMRHLDRLADLRAEGGMLGLDAVGPGRQEGTR